MGDRAIIKPVDNDTGIYLHWDGEKAKVKALLEYCKLCGFRPFGGKGADDYGIARLCQVAANWIGGSLSIGICHTDENDKDLGWSLDNGVYVVDGWDIVKRIGAYDDEDVPEEDLIGLLSDINRSQPIPLDEDYVTARIVEEDYLSIGDEIYVCRPERSSGAPCDIQRQKIAKYENGHPVTENGVVITHPVRIA